MCNNEGKWLPAIVMATCPFVMVSSWAAIMLHLQILQEEKHMHKMFGADYEEYRKHTLRYFGRRKQRYMEEEGK